MKIDKTIVVTGGDKGIGKAIVETLASSYEHVVFTYNTNLSGASDLMSRYENTQAFQCDFSCKKRVVCVVDQVIDQFKTIDILVNNVGYDDDAVFTKMEERQWCEVLDVNLYSLFYLSQKISKKMIEKGWGRIINLTSIAGYTGAFGKTNYATAKAGVVGFTKSLALELSNKGITVNAIAPGAIKTDMLMRIPEKYRMKILENIPSRKFGEPQDVANLVEFLSSEKANYITGQTIHVNGGAYML